MVMRTSATGIAWQPWDDAKLKALWLAGDSASVIAATFIDRSRNAVIARAKRIGLPGRPSPIKR